MVKQELVSDFANDLNHWQNHGSEPRASRQAKEGFSNKVETG